VRRITTISLHLRIVVGVLLLMTATFAFFAVWGGQARQQAQTQMEEERAVGVQLAAARVDSLIRGDLIVLREIAQALAEGRSDHLQSRRTSTLDRDPAGSFYGGVYLLDSSGRLLAGSDPIPGTPIGAVMPQSDLIGSLVKDGQPGVSGAVPFGPDGERSLLVAVPLTPSGDQAGAVLFGVTPLADSGFVEAIEPLALGQTGYAQIFDSTGRPLVDIHPERTFGAEVHQQRLAELLVAGQPEVTRCHSCHDPAGPVSDQQMMAFAPLASTGWGVVAAQSEAEILAPLRQLQWPLLWGSGILLAFALLFAWFAGRNVVKPLNRLMVACEGIAGGDLERPVPAVGVGEIRRLAHAFDTVRDRLAVALSQVVSWNVVLEERVEEKTEDLSLRNRELSALNEVLVAAGESLDLRTMLSQVAQTAGDVFGADAVMIFLAPRGEETMWHTGMVVPEPALRDMLREALPEGDGSDGSMEPVILDDVSGRVGPAWAALATAGVGSLAVVPLRFGERPVGSLALAFREPHGLSARDVGLLRSIGSQLALAIDRALLYQEQQRAAARASSLLGIATQISALESLDNVLERIVGEAATLWRRRDGHDRERLCRAPDREDGSSATRAGARSRWLGRLYQGAGLDGRLCDGWQIEARGAGGRVGRRYPFGHRRPASGGTQGHRSPLRRQCERQPVPGGGRLGAGRVCQPCCDRHRERSPVLRSGEGRSPSRDGCSAVAVGVDGLARTADAARRHQGLCHGTAED
jgi:GAF domain-containing protein/HAMP domain-containing protein